MFNNLGCPTKACTGTIEITEEWKENDFCKYVEGECPQCLYTYWLIKRGFRETIRDRNLDEDINFDQRAEDREDKE
jgi:hypothetical protein